MREADLALIRAVAGALAASALAAGCGFGEGETVDGAASLTITRDYGTGMLAEGKLTGISESDTVIRFLDREAEITTRFGDNFVQSIDGLAGRVEDGARYDWFFYVNGYWSPLGAGEARVHAGDRIWWDYREWNVAYRVPAVVGSFPEPFVHGYEGDRLDVVLDCRVGPAPACERIEAELASHGVESDAPIADDREALRILVGPYPEIGRDPAARLLEEGPEQSGVFARVEGDALIPLGVDGEDGGTSVEGLIAATRVGSAQPTWLITGADSEGVEAAAALFTEESLEDRFALAVSGGQPLPLPVEDDG